MTSVLRCPLDLGKVSCIHSEEVDLELALVRFSNPVGKVNSRSHVAATYDGVPRQANRSHARDRSQLVNAGHELGYVSALSDGHQTIA